MTDKHPEAYKLFKNIEKFSCTKTAENIAFGMDFPACASKQQCAEWVKYISSGLEENFDEPTIKKIRQSCYCRDGGNLEENKRGLKEIYADSKNIYDFVEKVNKYVEKISGQNAGWYIQNGYLFTKYFDCSCPMLDSIEILPTKTWCHCTAGLCKEIFDAVFSFEVDAEIIESLKMGDKHCLIKISNKDGSPLIRKN